MIKARIIEDNGLVALCTISGGRIEFAQDLVRLKHAVFYTDREWVETAKNWRVVNAEKHAQALPEIAEAIRQHKLQMTLPI